MHLGFPCFFPTQLLFPLACSPAPQNFPIPWTSNLLTSTRSFSFAYKYAWAYPLLKKKNLFSTLLLVPQLASSLFSVLKEEPSSGPPTRSFPPCNLASALVSPLRLSRPKGHQWLPHGQIQWCLLLCAPQPLLRSNSVDSAFLFHKYLFGSYLMPTTGRHWGLRLGMIFQDSVFSCFFS